ncbi:IS5 family transposase, partial [Azotobacter vinelandii]
MQLTAEQFKQIEGLLPRQRGNVRLGNLQVLNAILYVAANGCKWRALPERYGNWHTVYTRMMRWSKAGVLDRVFEQLQRQRLMQIRIEAISLDSSIVKVHPDGTGAPKKNGPQALGRSRGGWSTKLHLVAADDRNVVTWSLTAGQAGDAPEGRRLIQALGPHHGLVALLMDSAYQDNATRELACGLGFVPVVPPNPRRRQPWEYDKPLYRRRNGIERLFRRLKAWRRVFTRYDKLDLMYAAFVTVALIAEAL